MNPSRVMHVVNRAACQNEKTARAATSAADCAVKTRVSSRWRRGFGPGDVEKPVRVDFVNRFIRATGRLNEAFPQKH